MFFGINLVNSKYTLSFTPGFSLVTRPWRESAPTVLTVFSIVCYVG